MSHAQQLPSWMFNLEGTFLGFLGKDPDKPKSLALEVEQEEMAIQLPQELRAPLKQHLKPGDRIRCIGRSQIDFASGVIQLKAYQLFPFSPPPSPSPRPRIPLSPHLPPSSPFRTV